MTVISTIPPARRRASRVMIHIAAAAMVMSNGAAYSQPEAADWRAVAISMIASPVVTANRTTSYQGTRSIDSPGLTGNTMNVSGTSRATRPQ